MSFVSSPVSVLSSQPRPSQYLRRILFAQDALKLCRVIALCSGVPAVQVSYVQLCKRLDQLSMTAFRLRSRDNAFSSTDPANKDQSPAESWKAWKGKQRTVFERAGTLSFTAFEQLSFEALGCLLRRATLANVLNVVQDEIVPVQQ